MHQESRKNESVTEWMDGGKCWVMDTNIEYLCFLEVQVLEYLKLLGSVYGNANPDKIKRV